MLIKPDKLQPGDKVATVSPSGGEAGDPDVRWRYEQGVHRLETVFGLDVVPMPNSLKGSDFLYEHPEARAEDLMTAFKEESVKAIIANVGGDDSIRLLPYIDFDVIRNNPKIFMGYSDITVSHLFCLKAGITSFYGPAVLTDFAENVEMNLYTIEMIERTFFTNRTIGTIQAPDKWTSVVLEWDEANKNRPHTMYPNTGYEVLQGTGSVQGHLIGGCLEVLEMVKGTELWPGDACWDNAILFLEPADQEEPDMIKSWLRNYGAQGILQKANGLILGKPNNEAYYNEYKEVIRQVMREYHVEDLPVLYNLNFSHTEPRFILPYGALAEIDCQEKTFSILESGVQ